MSAQNTLTSTMSNVIVNLIPYWSSTLVTTLKWDSQYSLGINLIGVQLVKFIEHYLEDTVIVVLLIVASIVIVGTKVWGFKPFRYSSAELMGCITMDDKTITVNFNDYFLKINDYILQNCNIQNILKINDVEYPQTILNTMTNVMIEPYIYLTVEVKEDKDSIKNTKKVRYSFTSYKGQKAKGITIVIL